MLVYVGVMEKKKTRICNLCKGGTKSQKSPPKNICNIMFILFIHIFPSTLWNCWRASQNYVAFLLYVSTLVIFFLFLFFLTQQQQFPIALYLKSFLLVEFFCMFVCLFPGWGLLHVSDYWGCGKKKIYNFYWVMAHTSIEIENTKQYFLYLTTQLI